MAKSAVQEWDTTAGNNTDVDGVNIGEGCLPGNLNDGMRVMMAQLRKAVANQGSNIASAATTDIGAATGQYVKVTGTTTITGLGTVNVGTMRWVEFTGALTLTHNASSLILPGAANITTAAGDVGCFVSLGSGNWKCLAFEKASGQPVNEVSLVPTASVMPYAGTTEPTGWLFCYGQEISRSTYATLFAVISTTYGVGDGSTTFNLPDLRGRVVAGQDDMGGTSANRLTNQTGGLNGDTLGATGGAETHTLTSAQMPSHSHTLNHSTAAGGDADHFGASNAGTINSSKTTETAGSGGAHNNVQPTIILNYIIKT